MSINVTGKVALITGGGSGICFELVKILVGKGCGVLIADLALQPVAEEFIKSVKDPKVLFVKTDVTKWDELQHAFDSTMSEFGRLDIVVPGAGVFEPPFSNFWNLNKGTDTPDANSYKTLEINVTHPIRATQLAIDFFLRQKLGHGVVVHVSSVAAQMPFMLCPLYSASKHALSGFTRSLANLEPAKNIRVNAVAPARVRTPLWTTDKLKWIDEDNVVDWVTPQAVAEVMYDLITKEEHVGGTVLEVSLDGVRPVLKFGDPGPSGGKGFGLEKREDAAAQMFAAIDSNFGK